MSERSAVPGPNGAPATGAVFDRLADAIRSEQPVALASVIAGPGTGGKLLVSPHEASVGSLGDPDLDVGVCPSHGRRHHLSPNPPLCSLRDRRD